MTAPGCDWNAPGTSPSLAEQEVHVWRVNLDLPTGVLQSLDHSLSPDERERAQKFYFEHLRRRFTAGRGSLRAILGTYLKLPPQELRFTYEPHGKPKLDPQTGGRWLTFNLSHSHELALIAVARARRVGIDLEYQGETPDADGIAERYFAPEEYEVYCKLPPQEKQAAFFRCWTRKEAFIKAIGEGLSFPLDRFLVSFAPGEPARLLQISGNQKAGSEWTLFDLNPGPNYTAALAIPGNQVKLTLYQWM